MKYMETVGNMMWVCGVIAFSFSVNIESLDVVPLMLSIMSIFIGFAIQGLGIELDKLNAKIDSLMKIHKVIDKLTEGERWEK